jgi:hypothetical protein
LRDPGQGRADKASPDPGISSFDQIDCIVRFFWSHATVTGKLDMGSALAP